MDVYGVLKEIRTSPSCVELQLERMNGEGQNYCTKQLTPMRNNLIYEEVLTKSSIHSQLSKPEWTALQIPKFTEGVELV